MSRPPEPAPPNTAEKPPEKPKKNRSMTRKDFGELLKRAITRADPKKPDPKAP